MSDESQKPPPDSYYADRHANESAGVDMADVALLAQLAGTVKGELGTVDQLREGVSSGAPVSKITPDHLKNIIRNTQQPPVVQQPAVAQPSPVPVIVPPVTPSNNIQLPTAPVNTTDVSNIVRRLDILEKQHSRMFAPINLHSSYNVKSNKITGKCDTFDELLDLFKRCIKLKSKEVIITIDSEDKHNK